MAHIVLAAYDPANPSSAGDYWAWRHPELPKTLLDSFYYEIFTKHLPPYPEKIGFEDCVGGYAQIPGEWGCWYRFFNGGRDQFNRLGRFVIGCAFVRLRERPKGNVSQILDSPQFKELSRIASKSPPLPAPTILHFEFETVAATSNPALLSALKEGKIVEYNGEKAIHLAGDLVAFVPDDLACHCRISRMNGIASISCSRTYGNTSSLLPFTASTSSPLLTTSPPKYPGSRSGRICDILRRPISLPLCLLIFLLFAILYIAWPSIQRIRNSSPDQTFQSFGRLFNLINGQRR